MRRTFWLWILTLTLFVVIPGVVAARAEAPVALSQTLIGRKALRAGDRGPAVEALQRLLQERGFDPTKIDGIFGPLTERAVKQAQAELGLTEDGLAGVQTTAALETGTTVRRPTVIPADLFHAGADGPSVPSSRLVLHEAAAPAQPQPDAAFALTFNGVPDPALLPTILDTLHRHDMKATFFVTGAAASASPELLAAIAADGHEIGLTAQSAGLTAGQFKRQLLQAQAALKAATGHEATHFRPAGGLAENGAAASLGLTVALWTNVGVSDHPDLTPQELTERLTGAVYPGSVLMVHQDRPATVAALEPLLTQLAARGARSVTLSDLDRP